MSLQLAHTTESIFERLIGTVLIVPYMELRSLYPYKSLCEYSLDKF